MKPRSVIMGLTLCGVTAFAFAESTITKFAFVSGGGDATGTQQSLRATIGQDVTGVATSAHHTIVAGFWTPGTRSVPMDIDGDGDVDLSDYALFTECLANPAGTPLTGYCTRADADNDADVDLADFAAFQRRFGAAE